MTITGTSYFTDFGAAVSYYSAYEGRDARAAVERKLAAGEIHLGRPPLKEGETLCLCDGNRRYSIQTP